MAKSDKIIIRDLRFDAILGILDFERTTPQSISVDIVLEHDLSIAASSHKLEHSINYAQVCEEVTAFIQARKALLIESLAEDTAQFILQKFKPLSVNLRILKLAIIPNTNGVGVEITRTQEDLRGLN